MGQQYAAECEDGMCVCVGGGEVVAVVTAKQMGHESRGWFIGTCTFVIMSCQQVAYLAYISSNSSAMASWHVHINHILVLGGSRDTHLRSAGGSATISYTS